MSEPCTRRGMVRTVWLAPAVWDRDFNRINDKIAAQPKSTMLGQLLNPLRIEKNY